ncbi:MAG: tyrosine-type recombinase/integrase [Bacteroidales bacterium]|nr:tyrosine-type recombinase/integrase [Bacteroidales bacterium]
MFSERFIQHITFEKRYSPNTIIAYQKDLRQFFDYIASEYDIKNIHDINHSIIRSWIVYLANDSISSRSINRKLSTLKTFYKFLLKENLVKQNPLTKILPPKTKKRLPEFVNREKMDLLFDQVEFGDNFRGIRDKLIIEIFYFTGMRLSEMVNLTDTDVDIKNLKVKVLGKRNKERIIPFCNELRDLIIRYKEVRNKEIEITEPVNYFIVTEKGKKIYKKLVYRIVNSYLGKVSTLQKKSPHVLRHTFATHMLNNGADLNAIKEILGHANLAATQIYTHNTIENLKTIYKQAHPRA